MEPQVPMALTELLDTIKARMTALGFTTSKLAKALNKEVSTISRQLDLSKGYPNLLGVHDIAEKLGCRLVLETPERRAALEGSDTSAYRSRVLELTHVVDSLSAENARLREIIDDKDDRIKRRDKIMENQADTIRSLTDMLEYRGEALARKDELLNALVRKNILMEGKEG